MRSKKQIIKIMISTLLLLSCMILFVGCGNSKPQSAANNSTDTPQNDNADSNANGSDNEPAQNSHLNRLNLMRQVVLDLRSILIMACLVMIINVV